jgi:hypothetical protein
MKVTCRKYGEEHRFWWRYLREREHMEDQGTDRMVIKKPSKDRTGKC